MNNNNSIKDEKEYECEEYRDGKLNFDFYKSIITKEESNNLMSILLKEVKWPRKFTEYKRCGQTYGDEGITYDIHWYGTVTHRKTIYWLKCLLPIKKLIEDLTEQKYNICFIQYYPNGKVGIKKHRDKEMTPGTTICGLSLGSERCLKLERYGKEMVFSLPPGSLYVFNPPTNDCYTHCIEQDDTTEPRISLTFRNYQPKS